MGKSIYLTNAEIEYLIELLQTLDMHEEKFEESKKSIFAKVSKYGQVE